MKLLRMVLTVAAGIAAGYIVGYHQSPGPYIPAEDSFEYSHHHCVVTEEIRRA